MPYITNITCNCLQWVPWTNGLIQATNTVSPQTALISSTLGILPWLWPALSFILYILLFIAYSESPGRFKAVGIATIVLVISIVEAVSGLTNDAVLNFIVLIIAWLLSGIFRN